MSAPAAKTVTRTPFKKWCDENVGLLFLIPWIIGFVVFKLYPFATSLFYSFTDMNFFDGITKYGLMNYIYMVLGSAFRASSMNHSPFVSNRAL